MDRNSKFRLYFREYTENLSISIPVHPRLEKEQNAYDAGMMIWKCFLQVVSRDEVSEAQAREAAKKVNEYFLNSLMKTEDTLEGIRSFEEKRKPVWKNG